MGGNLMVFEVSKAPKTKKEFINWYYEQVDWKDAFDYDNPQNASINLQNWFNEMIITFPPMNGPFAPTDEQIDKTPELFDVHIVDYSISRDVIYFGFPYSIADELYNLTRQLAIKHGVGFFDVCTDDGDIILPDETYIHKKCWKYYKIK